MNILPISTGSFKGVYLSNALAPGYQRDKAKQIKDDFVKCGLDMKYEKDGQDILIEPGLNNEQEISIKFVPTSISRVLDDNYSRWNGRLY